MLRHCPNCPTFNEVPLEKRESICPNCDKRFKIKYTLSDIKLVSFSTNNYSFSENKVNEVLRFLQGRQTYIAEISRNVGLTEGQIRTIVRDLLLENKIVIEGSRRIKYISLR